MIRSILTVPNPLLRERAEPVAHPTSEALRALIKDLKDTCLAANGVGIAAQQIGVLERVCVINDPVGSPYGLINPEILWSSKGTSVLEEGCLSIPGEVVPVPRPRKVRVGAVSESGEPVEIAAGDFLAKVLQHEIDHLNGILITDYRSPLSS